MSVTAAQGFVAAGCHAGIKRRRYDMALIATEDGRPVPTAAVFTRNKFVAPPVVLDRERLRANGGQAVAVVVNSGNANAGTGKAGLADAEKMCATTAAALGTAAQDVLVCSTGIIGTPLPMAPILAAIPKLAKKLSVDHAEDAARGILTTDAQVSRAVLQRILAEASEATFNTLNVDGATSTNDTAMLMASGRRGKPEMGEFTDAVHRACADLTMQMALDAEGMTRIVELRVTGAASDGEARIAAKAIAENNLVKCSWHGGDPYWGRLLAAAGSSGVAFKTEKSRVTYGGVVVAKGGTAVAHDGPALAEHMALQRIAIEVHLGAGRGSAVTIGIDLGPGYIKENSGTS